MFKGKWKPLFLLIRFGKVKDWKRDIQCYSEDEIIKEK